jgi:hypothetical protein
VSAAGFGPNGASSGYTPASYITYSEDERHFCAQDATVVVDAPASVCFGLWDDWHRLVDYMDLIAQVGRARRMPCPRARVRAAAAPHGRPAAEARLMARHPRAADRPGPQRAGHGAVPVLLQMGCGPGAAALPPGPLPRRRQGELLDETRPPPAPRPPALCPA